MEPGMNPVWSSSSGRSARCWCKECYACHSPGSEGRSREDFGLIRREGLAKGGDSGPAIVGGKPDESLLLDALRHDGIEMPPKGKLPDSVIGDFERWVKIGAPTRAAEGLRPRRHPRRRHQRRRRPEVLGLSTAATARAPGGARYGLACHRHRPLPLGGARSPEHPTRRTTPTARPWLAGSRST